MSTRIRHATYRTGRRVACLALWLTGLAGGSCVAPTEPSAAVRFAVDAPFCVGTRFPLRFYIDAALVGVDTLMDGQESEQFVTSPGPHRLRAEFWTVRTVRDTTVSLLPGANFRMDLDFYCS